MRDSAGIDEDAAGSRVDRGHAPVAVDACALGRLTGAHAFDESDRDVMERWHTVQFLTMDDDGGEAELVGHIRHSLKRIEAQLGRYYWTECRFEVHTPDTPRQQARYDEVEDEVKILLTRLKALDRGRRLIPA